MVTEVESVNVVPSGGVKVGEPSFVSGGSLMVLESFVPVSGVPVSCVVPVSFGPESTGPASPASGVVTGPPVLLLPQPAITPPPHASAARHLPVSFVVAKQVPLSRERSEPPAKPTKAPASTISD